MTKKPTRSEVLQKFGTAISVLGKDAVVIHLSKITYREREILKLRFGFGDGYCYTFQEVAHIFKTTVARIRQIEEKAIRKMCALMNEVKVPEIQSMNIDEAKRAKIALAESVGTLVREFELRTGLTVLSISLGRKEYSSSEMPAGVTKSLLTGVHVSVRI